MVIGLIGLWTPQFTSNNPTEVDQVIAQSSWLGNIEAFSGLSRVHTVTSTHSFYCHFNGYLWALLSVLVEESSTKNKQTNRAVCRRFNKWGYLYKHKLLFATWYFQIGVKFGNQNQFYLCIFDDTFFYFLTEILYGKLALQFQLSIHSQFLVLKLNWLFWTPGLPDGVHSNYPCWSVRMSICLSSKTALRMFLKFFMNVRYHTCRKVLEPDFWKNS